jgi:hypothetical protein
MTNLEQTEMKKARLKMIALAIAVVLGIATLVIIGFTSSYFGIQGMLSNQDIKKRVANGTRELNSLLESDLKILNEYKKIDSVKVSLPIERAMEILISEKEIDTRLVDKVDSNNKK